MPQEAHAHWRNVAENMLQAKIMPLKNEHCAGDMDPWLRNHRAPRHRTRSPRNTIVSDKTLLIRLRVSWKDERCPSERAFLKECFIHSGARYLFRSRMCTSEFNHLSGYNIFPGIMSLFKNIMSFQEGNKSLWAQSPSGVIWRNHRQMAGEQSIDSKCLCL